MRERLIRLLLGRSPVIREKFLRFRKKGGGRLKGLGYLLWLQLLYGWRPEAEERERIALYAKESESSFSRRAAPEEFAQELARYGAVSFDVFDTLLFRPFSDPADLFYLAGMELHYPDFRRIRMQTEARARRQRKAETGSAEVTFEEIWTAMEEETGIPRERGMEVEFGWELRCCTANPYMRQAVEALQRQGRRVFAVSDMYLGEARIRRLLEGCGYTGLAGCLVSGDEGVSKWEGGLYRLLRDRLGPGVSAVHVGDNPRADVRRAREAGLAARLYPNVSQAGRRYRPHDMTPITGSLYRGLVNIRLHSGLDVCSREYEYGFVYGGLFAAGYCRFIHAYAEAHNLDRVLFLSRDGAALLRAYRLLYPEEGERAVYAYWSRLAAVKVTAGGYKAAYFRQFLDHKAGGGFSLRRVLAGMELEDWLPDLCRTVGAHPADPLTHKNLESVKSYVQRRWPDVLERYAPQAEAAGRYYAGLLRGCRRAAAVDIGWAGSGAVMLDYAVNRQWGLDCPVAGLLAGTLSAPMTEADGTAPFLFSGVLESYLFAAGENRDLWKRHDPIRGDNLYWERLLGSTEGSLVGFYPDGRGGTSLRFRPPPAHPERIAAIHEGLLDFVRLFLETERRLGVTIPVSGRDAYAPMIAVCDRKNRRFRKGLEALLDEPHIG